MSGIDPNELLAQACPELPIFPLPSVAFFPATLLPLHVFEPRYRELVQHCMAGNRVMGVPQLGEGWQDDYDGNPPLTPTMGVGRVVRARELPDGRYNIILFGLGRARIDQELTSSHGFRVVRATPVPDLGTPADFDERIAEAVVLARALMPNDPLGPSFLEILEAGLSPVPLVDTLAHVVLDDPEQRQDYLEQLDPGVRAAQVSQALLERMATRPVAEA